MTLSIQKQTKVREPSHTEYTRRGHGLVLNSLCQELINHSYHLKWDPTFHVSYLSCECIQQREVLNMVMGNET